MANETLAHASPVIGKARHRTDSAALVMQIQGADTVETVAVYIGMLGLDFTVTEPAELLGYLTRSRSVTPEPFRRSSYVCKHCQHA
jgi:hypothetical protein